MNKTNPSRAITIVCFSLLLTSFSSCFSGRHIPKLRRPDVAITDTIKAVERFDTDDLLLMESLLKSAQEKAQKSDFVNNIDECIYLIVDDKVAFTVVMDGKDIKVGRGIMPGVTPTLFIPFTPSIGKNLVEILSDYKLDSQEKFNICYVVFMPCLNRMYAMPYLYETSMFNRRLDDYLQFAIRNPDRYTYHGKEVEISGTVVNVDGMFITMPGLVGDPDIRLELTLDQAIELYRYVVYDAVKKQSASEKIKLFKKYAALINASKVYERKWH